MASRSMADSTGVNNLSESVEELRMRLEAMKQMMENEETEEERTKSRRKCKESCIDGSLLSFIFVFVLVLIICVSFYAFQNLYYAVLKKFPVKPHTEL